MHLLRIGIIVFALLGLGSETIATPTSESKQHTLNSETARHEHGKSIADELESITPYVSMDDQLIATLDEDTARQAKLSPKTISMAKRYFDEQNRLNNEVLKGNVVGEISLDPMVLAEFEDYFFYKVKGKTPAPDTNIVNPEFASGACGGYTDNPHPCPPREKVLINVTLEQGQGGYLLSAIIVLLLTLVAERPQALPGTSRNVCPPTNVCHVPSATKPLLQPIPMAPMMLLCKFPSPTRKSTPTGCHQ